MAPILHLSLPVADLATARAFYVDTLGCDPGRCREGWIDVWFYGLQLTLHERPEQVLDPTDTGVRHFGVTLDRATLDVLASRLVDADVDWVDELGTDYPGTAQEQTKAKLRDPSGNVIEIKAYSDSATAFAESADPPTLLPDCLRSQL